MSAVDGLPQARLAWLSFSDKETDDARTLIAALQQPGVVDELGFAPLVSAFAERFYPATTTVMTRCRYLFFVPAIYRYMERQAKLDDSKTMARKLQDLLRETLAENEKTGVIGVVKGINVERLPSNVYWAALGELGVFTRDTSEGAYLDHLDARGRQRRPVKDHDERVMRQDEEPSWDPAFAVPEVDGHGRFDKAESFALTRGEARQLTKRFIELDTRRGMGPSLLSHLIERRDEWWPAKLAWPWMAARLAAPLRTATVHARALSNLARGVTIQYHHMLTLARAAAGYAVSDKVDLRELFRIWWNRRADHGFSAWDLNELGSLPLLADVRTRSEDLAFLRAWHACVEHSKSADAALDDALAASLVRERERRKRPNKARLPVGSKFLEPWGPRDEVTYGGPFELEYRHRIGSSFAEDIVRALTEQKA